MNKENTNHKLISHPMNFKHNECETESQYLFVVIIFSFKMKYSVQINLHVACFMHCPWHNTKVSYDFCFKTSPFCKSSFLAICFDENGKYIFEQEVMVHDLWFGAK